MTSSTNDFERMELEEIFSKIHDERKCVTTKSLALEMGIPRKKAASLLEAIPYYKPDGVGEYEGEGADGPFVYDVVRCVWKESKDGKRVAKLRKTQLKVDPTNQPSESSKNTIHSLALNTQNHGSTSPQNAHAYTMTLLFNALEDGSLMDKIQQDTVIQPVQDIHFENQESLRRKRITALNSKNKSIATGLTANHGGNSKLNGSSTTTITKKRNTFQNNNVSKKKVTTAAAFFGSQSKTTKKSTNGEPKKDVSKSSLSKSQTKDPNEKENIIKSKNGSSTTQSQSKRKNRIESSLGTTKVVSSSQSSSISSKKQRTASSTQKGNADDFVGDEDEDEDFLHEEKQRKERVAEQERQLARRRSKQKNQKVVVSNNADDMDIDEDNEKRGIDDDGEKKLHVTGAIDAFATTKTSKKEERNSDGSNQKGRKRRKQVMEEKTYVDENGYFRTETVAVWKEVEEDEIVKESEKAKSTQTKPKKLKNTKGMKQQGLKGFFVKKS